MSSTFGPVPALRVVLSCLPQVRGLRSQTITEPLLDDSIAQLVAVVPAGLSGPPSQTLLNTLEQRIPQPEKKLDGGCAP